MLRLRSVTCGLLKTSTTHKMLIPQSGQTSICLSSHLQHQQQIWANDLYLGGFVNQKRPDGRLKHVRTTKKSVTAPKRWQNQSSWVPSQTEHQVLESVAFTHATNKSVTIFATRQIGFCTYASRRAVNLFRPKECFFCLVRVCGRLAQKRCCLKCCRCPGVRWNIITLCKWAQMRFVVWQIQMHRARVRVYPHDCLTMEKRTHTMGNPKIGHCFAHLPGSKIRDFVLHDVVKNDKNLPHKHYQPPKTWELMSVKLTAWFPKWVSPTLPKIK